jgi:nitronate monooxygenase
MLVQLRGMKKLEQAVRPGTYQQLWSAGQSVEMVEDIVPTQVIVQKLVQELNETLQAASQLGSV